MSPELNRKLDYSDLVATPDDGRRYELVQGDLMVTPSPSPVHQRVSKRLERQLEDYFEERSLGEVFNAPIDLILGTGDVFVPDLVVVPVHGSYGPPWYPEPFEKFEGGWGYGQDSTGARRPRAATPCLPAGGADGCVLW